MIALTEERDAEKRDKEAALAVIRRFLDGWMVEDGQWFTFFDGPGEITEPLSPEESRILDLLN